MATSISLIVSLLTAAVSLLTFVQQNPNLPPAARDNAREMAENAIKQATTMLAESSASTTATMALPASSSTPEKVIPPPKIEVSANPPRVEYGGKSIISWDATDALSCILDSSPNLLAARGSQSVAPSGDWAQTSKIIFTLTCTGAGGSTSESVAVTVEPWTPPTGLKVLPAGQCTPMTAPCTTGPEGLFCLDRRSSCTSP